MMTSSDTIPLLDLEHWDEESDQKLVASLSEFGLAHIAGHGIADHLLSDFYSVFRDVLERPVDEKSGWGGADNWFQRGWTPPDTERAVAAGGQPDFKECYFVAPLATDPECVLEHPQIYAANVWPNDAEDFKATYLRLGRRLHENGLRLLEAMARGLNLAVDVFTKVTEGGPHVTRALKYLELNQAQCEGGVLWGEEHTDFNLLTLLPGGRFYNQADVQVAAPDIDAGLYLRTRSGRKVRGTAPKGAIVIQVGQQLEILTGGKLLATPHVVTAPSAPGFTRCSAAHFVHMHAHEMVRPLPEFASREAVTSYAPPVLSGTYGLKTLVDIGLAPAEAIDTLGYRHYGRLASQRLVDDD
jgi:isopenicillin N synthase-like dioxygenase